MIIKSVACDFVLSGGGEVQIMATVGLIVETC